MFASATGAEAELSAKLRRRIDDDLRSYLREAAEIKENKASDPEEHYFFLRNVLREVGGAFKSAMCDAQASHSLGTLLDGAPSKIVARALFMLRGSFAAIAYDTRGSHVLQKLLSAYPPWSRDFVTPYSLLNRRLQDEDADETGDLQPDACLCDVFLAAASELREVWPNLIRDAAGSHVARTLLWLAAGLQPRTLGHQAKALPDASGSAVGAAGEHSSAGAGRSGVSNGAVGTQAQAVPSLISDTCVGVADCLVEAFPRLGLANLAADKYAGPTLAVLLEALSVCPSAPGLAGLFCARLLLLADLGLGDQADSLRLRHLNGLMKHAVGSHTLEACIRYGGASLQRQLFDTVFAEHVAEWALHGTANHVLQQLVGLVSDSKLALRIVTELASFVAHTPTGMAELLARACGVLAAVFKLCAQRHRLAAPVDKAMRVFLDALLLWTRNDDRDQPLSPVWLCYVILNAKPGAPISRDNVHVHLTGALAAEALFSWPAAAFPEPFASFCAIERDVLAALARDRMGSHVLEAFLRSDADFVSKNALARSLADDWLSLSMDRVGSRVIETIFRECGIAVRERMAKTFAGEARNLGRSFFGRFVLDTVGIDLFQANREAWRERERAREKAHRAQAAPAGEKASLQSDAQADQAAPQPATPSRKRPARESDSEEAENQPDGASKKKKKKKRRHDDVI